MPDTFWDDVPAEITPIGTPIPELLDDSELVKVFPELQNLAKYGGATLEANLQAASMRYKLINQEVDKARVKIRAMNSADPLIGANYEVQSISPFGQDIPDTGISTLAAQLVRNAKARKAAETLLGTRYSMSTIDLRNLVNLLRNDNPNESVQDIVAKTLTRGVTLKPSRGSLSAVGQVSVPFKIEDGLVKPAVDLSEYKKSISQLDDFTRNRSLPDGFDTKSISVRISPTQSDFESQYRAISTTDRDLSRTQGVNFTLRSDSTEATTKDLRTSLSDKTTVIILNHEVAQGNDADFGEGNSIAETLAHEYGHTVHRSMGLDWGYTDIENPNPKNAAYDAIFGQDVSAYGKNNPREHFAESFAKLVFSGKATPEFEKFLEEQVGFTKFDINKLVPEILRGNNLRQSIETLNNTDLGGYSIKLTSFNNSLRNQSEADIAEMARNAARAGRVPTSSVGWTGTVYDSNGRVAGEFTRTLNRDSDGKLWVYHNLFRMQGSAQGGGFGTKFIDASFDLYRTWGVDRVEVTAGLDNGPYMWGLMGFDFMSEQDRLVKLSSLEAYLTVLSKYNDKQAEYDSLESRDVATKIFEDLTASDEISRNSRVNNRLSVEEIIARARRNGWKIDNDFINEMRFLLSLPQSEATAQRIAELGRRNKKSSDKTTSSIGRAIMMERGWRGRKYL